MSTTALTQGKQYYDALMDAEYRGRKDKNGSARSRLADLLGVKENKLIRLEYKIEEMKDIGGELYRRLRLHYERLCEANEKAADSYREQRLALRKNDAADQEPVASVPGMERAAAGKEEAVK